MTRKESCLIGLELDVHINCDKCIYNGEKLAIFHELGMSDLEKLVKSMNNKCCSLDPLPPWLLISCFEQLGPILLHIVNCSLRTGMFPDLLKKAVVKPVIKDFKDDIDSLANYRPISNIAFLSKLVEKAVSYQLNEHLNKNNLYCSSQSGYRQFHSCETLNIAMFDKILKDIDDGNVVVLLLLDMSAAFDTIDHSILLRTLNQCYGISDVVHQWFSSYLTNRNFSVKVYDKFSDYICSLFGVPQGSILGPILFILYTKHLQHIALKHCLNIQLYADDSQLYISFKPLAGSELCTSKIEMCLAEIKKFVCSQYLKLNEKKTKLLLLSKPSVGISYNMNCDPIVVSCMNNTIEEFD